MGTSVETDGKQPGMALLSFAHGHQSGWANTFKASGQVQCRCVWDEDPLRGQTAAQQLGIPYFAKLEDALGFDGVTAVTICSTNDAHADLAVAAARAGKDIMMQKPMATTLADCDRIVEAVEQAGVLYYQSHNLRYDPVHLKIKDLVDSGTIGTVGLARRRHSHAFALTNQALLDRMHLADPVKAGGGAFMDEGAHTALWFLWMFGRPESVTGIVSTKLSQQLPGVEEAGVLLYRYSNGMIGVHQSSWVELASTSTIEIFGDQGTIVADGTDITSARVRDAAQPALRIWHEDPRSLNGTLPRGTPIGHWEVSEAQLPANRLTGTAEAFIHLLTTRQPSPADARTGRIAVAMVLAGYKASVEGHEIPVER
ncbi:MAG: Gfo/Idh/MocA family oxidoreductase [Chloroflexi bacterium]|nr:Gfo/Idh/MocA family oxidoreductase [Chloroflexota bacterium]